MRIILIGLGAIGQRHARNLRALLGAEAEFLAYRVRRLRHVVTPELESDASRDVERELGITVFSDLEAALALAPSIAIVANPSSMHVDVALRCVRAGCDLFVEKPISDSPAGSAELVGAVRERARIAMAGYQMRFHPCFERLSEYVASGKLGNLLSVRVTVGEYLPDWHRYEDYRTMYAARADLGGGVVLTQIHEFDYLYALFGIPERVFALGGHWSQLELDVEDVASALLQFRWNGRSLPVHVSQDYLQRPASRSCEIVGDRGKVVADFSQRVVTFADFATATAHVAEIPAFDRNELYLSEMRHFLDCVKRRSQPLVTLEAAHASLSIALAVKRSIASGMPAEVEQLANAHAS